MRPKEGVTLQVEIEAEVDGAVLGGEVWEVSVGGMGITVEPEAATCWQARNASSCVFNSVPTSNP